MSKFSILWQCFEGKLGINMRVIAHLGVGEMGKMQWWGGLLY